MGVSMEHADPNDPIVISTAAATKIFFRPIISASEPATIWPNIDPKRAAEATAPSNERN